MLDPLSTWLSEYEKLPVDKTGDDSPKNIANFLDQRVNKKMDLKNSTVKMTPPPQFMWAKGVFQSLFAIITKIPVPDQITPAISIATAWQSSILASGMIIQTGASMNPPPPGTNAIVGSAVAILDPPTLAAAYSTLISDLVNAKPSSKNSEAEFPKAMYKAFSSLTYTITGVDTKPPPTGPIPFTLPLTGVQ